MNYKRINITVPEKDLNKIIEYCSEKKLSKSFVIREATLNYITQKELEKELEIKKKNIKAAIKIQDRLRAKAKFNTKNTAVQMIRKLRDKR